MRCALLSGIVAGLLLIRPSQTGAQEQAPDFLGALDRFLPKTIRSVAAASHRGRIHLFYELGSVLPGGLDADGKPIPREGEGFQRVWDGSAWGKEAGFASVTDAFSTGDTLWALTEGGYYTSEDGRAWSQFVPKPEWRRPFGCASKNEPWVFYMSGARLMMTVLRDGAWSDPEIVEENWKYHEGGGFPGMPYRTQAFYAFDRLWLFWIQPSQQGLTLAYKSSNGLRWDETKDFGPATRFEALPAPGGPVVFYVNWQPESLNESSLANLPAQMGKLTENLARVFYRRFDGERWSPAESVPTGQTLLFRPVAREDDLWLFSSDGQRTQYSILRGGRWDAPRSPTGMSARQERIAQRLKSAATWLDLGLTAFLYGIMGLAVLGVSSEIESRKKVVLQLGGRWRECASLLRRFCAYAADTMLIHLVKAVLPSPELDLLGELDVWAVARFFGLSILSYLLLAFGYFFLCEGAWGKTLGKKILGIRVVSLDGGPCSWRASATRNLFRLGTSLMSNLVAAAVLAFTEKHQRVGDVAAKTLVIVDGEAEAS